MLTEREEMREAVEYMSSCTVGVEYLKEKAVDDVVWYSCQLRNSQATDGEKARAADELKKLSIIHEYLKEKAVELKEKIAFEKKFM